MNLLIGGVAMRFSNFEHSKTLTLTTFHDSRFKNVSSPQISEDVKKRVVTMVGNNSTGTGGDMQEPKTNKPSIQVDELPIWSDLDGMLAKKKKKGTNLSRAIIEVDR